MTGRADLAAMNTEFNDRLAENNVEAAHLAGLALYTAADADNDHDVAGRVAYAMASIASLRDETPEVPVWFDRCARHYKALNFAAQHVDCIHKAALSYKAQGKPGTSRDRLKSAEGALEQANAAETIVAALIYADLAESYIPPQFETGASADADRQRVLDYTQSARAILAEHGQDGHFLYATLLAREATAFEDLKRFEDALPPMTKAMEMIANQPEHAELYADLRRRHAKMAAWISDESNDRNLLTVEMEDGREVTLKIKRRTRVIYPRSEGMSSEYGLGRVLITLGPEGKVAHVDIVESTPTPAFGEAVKKAVERWSFTPEDDTPSESIPPFRFGISFDYVRRR
nr:energy transducer TonB [Hyphomonas sp. Mor2]